MEPIPLELERNSVIWGSNRLQVQLGVGRIPLGICTRNVRFDLKSKGLDADFADRFDPYLNFPQ